MNLSLPLLAIAAVLTTAPALAAPEAGGGPTAPADPVEPRERYIDMFHQLDEDGSQSLSVDEAVTVGLTPESFQRLDKNANGSLELDEFLELIPSDEAVPGAHNR